MSRPSPRREAWLAWCGPALAALGLLTIAAAALLPGLNDSPLARWILADTLAPARILPLIGFGFALAMISATAVMAALLFATVGIAGALLLPDRLLALLDLIPKAATHLFFAGPISFLAIGAALVGSDRWRTWLTPPAALIVAAMAGLMVKLSDPSLHEPAYTWTPVLATIWIVAAVAMTLRAFQRPWFSIFARILGSWLLAIGLLYGGASLMPPKPDLAPPPMPVPDVRPDIPQQQP